MIQITIHEKDNPKVAGWLMDNNIEYSSKPIVETGKNKPFIVANVREILDLMQGEEISYSRGVELLNEVAADYYGKQPVPVQEGKSKEVAAIDEFPIYPIFADVLENITWEGFINNLRLAFIDGAEWQHKTQSPVPVSVGYSLDDMEKMLGPVVHPTEQQDKGEGLD